MRLIDADELKTNCDIMVGDITIGRRDYVMFHEIDSAPTIDAVEVVRCKDCKNSEHWYRDRRRCFLWSEDGVSVFDDGFCSYAERRTDETN